MNRKGYPFFYDYITGNPRPFKGSERFYIDRRPALYYRLHHHDYAELSYYVEGHATESINGVQHPLQPGTLSFLLPYQIHVTTGNAEQRILKYCCMFDMEILLGIEDDNWLSQMVYSTGTLRPSFVNFVKDEQERIQQIFDILLTEYHNPESPERYHMIRTKLQEVILLFIGKVNKTNPDTNTIVAQEDSELIWPLLKYINTKYTEQLALKDLSEQFHLSVSYISRFFKKHVGMGLTEYVHRLRIERASNLLLHTKMSITEIAIEVGFESTRTFSRVFRDIKGMSAKDFRNAMKVSTSELIQPGRTSSN